MMFDGRVTLSKTLSMVGLVFLAGAALQGCGLSLADAVKLGDRARVKELLGWGGNPNEAGLKESLPATAIKACEKEAVSRKADVRDSLSCPTSVEILVELLRHGATADADLFEVAAGIGNQDILSALTQSGIAPPQKHYVFKENMEKGRCKKGCNIEINQQGNYFWETCEGKVTGKGALVVEGETNTQTDPQIPFWINRALIQNDGWQAKLLITSVDPQSVSGTFSFRAPTACSGSLRFVGRTSDVAGDFLKAAIVGGNPQYVRLALEAGANPNASSRQCNMAMNVGMELGNCHYLSVLEFAMGWRLRLVSPCPTCLNQHLMNHFAEKVHIKDFIKDPRRAEIVELLRSYGAR